MCSVHAGYASGRLQARLCAVKVNLTMWLGFGAIAVVSRCSKTSSSDFRFEIFAGLLQGPARTNQQGVAENRLVATREGWGYRVM